MKKEIWTGVLLIVMLVAAVVNIHFLNRLTDNVSGMIQEASDYAQSGSWDQAAEAGEKASEMWKESDNYTHLVLRHSELEATTDAIYNFLEAVYAQEQGTAKGAAMAALSRLDSISSIEQVRLGSIF